MAFGDHGIYWRLNQKRFYQEFRDQALIQAAENRLDKVILLKFGLFCFIEINFISFIIFKNSGNIIRVVLKYLDARVDVEKANQNTHLSKTITAIDVRFYCLSSLSYERILNLFFI